MLPNLDEIYKQVKTICKIEHLCIIKRQADLEGVYVFKQEWGTTAGGFLEPNTFAGQSITEQYTTVVQVNKNLFFVFFGVSGFAYCVMKPNKQFLFDLANRNMACVGEVKKYR